jgi:hypothetical protein
MAADALLILACWVVMLGLAAALYTWLTRPARAKGEER